MNQTYPFAQKVLQSLEPQIIHEPPTSDWREETLVDMRHTDGLRQTGTDDLRYTTDMVGTQEVSSPMKNVSLLSTALPAPVTEHNDRTYFREERSVKEPNDPTINHELYKMDTYYRELMDKERKTFERIL